MGARMSRRERVKCQGPTRHSLRLSLTREVAGLRVRLGLGVGVPARVDSESESDSARGALSHAMSVNSG
jgi:hypothetical protein